MANSNPLSSGGKITIHQFRTIELRIGKIVSAAAHPNADRLLVLQVDVGGEQRQVVAGIKGSYQPETLVGKCVVVVANLEAATIRGVESQGMVLATQEGDRVVLVAPDAPVAPGNPVK